MGLVTAYMINEAHRNSEFKIFIVYGPLGYGKSSYALQVLAEVMGTWDINILQNYMFFHPKDFLDKCLQSDGAKQQKVIIWDDAGLWLYALEFNNPFIRSVSKYLSVIRTDYSAIILTAPLPTWITNKIRNLPQAITLKIIKTNTDQQGPKKAHLRRAVAYRYWVHPDMHKSGVRHIYDDDFSVMLPDEVYDWYLPLRRGYAQVAKQIMQREIRHVSIEKMEKAQEPKEPEPLY